ncbi:MAG: BBP7 family outer membrane beta-barrel protein [Thermoguttaceae bacterium]
MNSRKFIGTAICAILALAASSAVTLGRDDPAAHRLIPGDAEESPAMDSGMAMDQAQGSDSRNPSCCNPGCCNPGCCQRCYCPRWTASADFIILDRVGSVDQTLVEEVPIGATAPPSIPLLNANAFRQGFHGGPRLDLIRHGDCCYDLELMYFQIDGWDSGRTVLDSRSLQFSAPGGFIFPNFGADMEWDYASKLYNAEINVQWNPCCRVTMLAGFRWVELRENLEGALAPSTLEPFWNTNTKNNLYGFQIGADGKIWDCGCFSVDGLVKAGIFGNHAEQLTAANDGTTMGVFGASTNHTAFLGEVGLQCKYQVTCSLTLRAGYEAIWLQGVALAPGQIQETNVNTNEIGINSNSGVFYHGATAGFEYSF